MIVSQKSRQFFLNRRRIQAGLLLVVALIAVQPVGITLRRQTDKLPERQAIFEQFDRQLLRQTTNADVFFHNQQIFRIRPLPDNSVGKSNGRFRAV